MSLFVSRFVHGCCFCCCLETRLTRRSCSPCTTTTGSPPPTRLGSSSYHSTRYTGPRRTRRIDGRCRIWWIHRPAAYTTDTLARGVYSGYTVGGVHSGGVYEGYTVGGVYSGYTGPRRIRSLKVAGVYGGYIQYGFVATFSEVLFTFINPKVWSLKLEINCEGF